METNIEVESNTLINVLTQRVTMLTNEGILKDTVIETLQAKLKQYEIPEQEPDVSNDEE